MYQCKNTRTFIIHSRALPNRVKETIKLQVLSCFIKLNDNPELRSILNMRSGIQANLGHQSTNVQVIDKCLKYEWAERYIYLSIDRHLLNIYTRRYQLHGAILVFLP